jgi:hypothetical protein
MVVRILRSLIMLKSLIMLRLSFSLVLVCCITICTAQGVKVIGSQGSNGEAVASGAYTLWLDADRMLIEQKDANAQMGLLFNKKNETLTMIDHKAKSYTTITKEEAETMAEMKVEMEKNMEEMMAALTEEQQAALREQLAKQDQMKQSSATYEPNGSNETINGWACKGYTGTKDGVHVKDVFAAELATLGLTEADIAVMDSFSELFKTLANPSGDKLSLLQPASLAGQAYEGVPVKIIRYKGDKAISENVIESVTKLEIPADVWTIPSEYAAKPFME